MITKQRIENLERIATRLRRHIIGMTTAAKSGHPGGSLSAADIVAALYFEIMNVAPGRANDPDRDRFVLSKGHAAPVLYAALAERGFFSTDELTTVRRLGSHLQGHPDMKNTPGVEMSTGSLGQGLSVAVGMALAGRLDRRDYRVFALLGDGELQEGQIWEAAMAASHHRLSSLTAIIDNNMLQIDGLITDVMSPLPIAGKFQAFGWETIEIDGHDMEAITTTLSSLPLAGERPSAIIARTVKGKGVSFMENLAGWHGRAPTPDEASRALAELVEGGVTHGE